METDLLPAWHFKLAENACIGDYYQCAKIHVCI